MPFNKGGNHWIILRASLRNNVNAAFAISIDHKNDDEDFETKQARICFSKLIGIYYDILTHNHAYAGPKDIYHSFMNNLQCYERDKHNLEHKFSLIGNTHLTRDGKQQDNFNCGVITCLNNLHYAIDQEDILSQSEVSQLRCTLWRERFCSFIQKLVEKYNSMSSGILTSKKASAMVNDLIEEKETESESVSNKEESLQNEDKNESQSSSVTLSGKKLDASNDSIVKEVTEKLDASNDFKLNETTEKLKDYNKTTSTPSPNISSSLQAILPSSTGDAELPHPKQLSKSFSDVNYNTPKTSMKSPSKLASNTATSVSKLDEESIKKYLHGKSSKKERRFKSTALNMKGTSSSTPIGSYIPESKSLSILQQLIQVMYSKLYHEKEDGEEFFKKEMERYETYYITDCQYYEPSNPFNKNDVIAEDSTPTIVTVAIIEIADFGSWTCTHRSKIEKNEIVRETKKSGYKVSDKAVIVHHIATRDGYEGHGYASYLLKWIGESFHGSATFVYKIMPPPAVEKEVVGNIPSTMDEQYAALSFFQKRKFESDPKGTNYNLSIVDCKTRSQKAISSNENEVYRVTTALLKNIPQQYLYGTAKFGKLDKYYLAKLCYVQKIFWEDKEDDFIEIIMSSLKEFTYDHELKDIKTDGDSEKTSVVKIKNPYKKKAKKEKQNDIKNDLNLKTSAEGENDNDKVSKTLSTEPKESNVHKAAKHKGKKLPINPNNKPKLAMAFYGFNPHFGWKEYNEDHLVTVDRYLLDSVKSNEGKIIKIPGGFRKEEKHYDVSMENVSLLPRIKHVFHVSSRASHEIGTCQWISAAMLIHQSNENESAKMLDFMKKRPEAVNWKPMFLGPDSLCSNLPLVTNFVLKKVKRNTSNFIQFLMNQNEGLYVCVLTDNNYAEKHVVGIDCGVSPKLIWDCAEKQALELTEKNLDRCTGSGNYCIKVRTIGEIVPKRKKMVKKRKYQDMKY